MTVSGTVLKYGDDVNTDVIIPARYLNTSDYQALARHCMEDLDPSFVKRVRRGDILVAGKNFGCGSSREHAPVVLQKCGISCVIAASFARIFYRNAINTGLAILECPAAVAGISAGDRVEIDFATGAIYNRSTGASFQSQPFPPFIQAIIDAGGLLATIPPEE